MGTALTGLEIRDTYDALIKVTDNGPLSGTAKYLSDGLGNDSVLALSTAVVGINTSSPNTSYPLSIASASNANAIAVFGRASDNTGSIDFYQSNGSSRILEFGVSTTQVDIYNDLNTPMIFSTNATERMRITGAGNVGIGTSPLLRLDVKGAAADTTTFGGVTVEQTTLFRPSSDAGGMRFGFDASSNAYLWSATSGASLLLGTRLAPDNNVNMAITSAGNVGIGTSAPNYSLQVNSSTTTTRLQITNSTTGTSSANGLQFIQDGNNTTISLKPSGFMSFETANNERLRITAAGNVGIGNSAPTAKLDVTGTLAVSGTSTFSSAITAATGSNFTGTAVNSSIAVTASGVANTVLGFNNSGSTANGVVNNAGYIGILQDYPLVVTIADAEKMRITGAGNVGIGTSSPSFKLSVNGGYIQNTDGTRSVLFGSDGTGALAGTNTNHYFRFITNDAERLRITEDGYVRLTSGSGGIQFNSDTAAANALDDYEEGTFTPSIAFGGGSTGITYFDRQGNYTKIGRQVFVTLYIALTNSGSSTGSATIEGLPFTNGNVNRGNQAAGSIRFDNITYTGTPQVFVPNSTTQIKFQQVTEAGTDSLLTEANFNSASEMSISLSYFV